jgi:hypothetical protein
VVQGELPFINQTKVEARYPSASPNPATARRETKVPRSRFSSAVEDMARIGMKTKTVILIFENHFEIYQLLKLNKNKKNYRNNKNKNDKRNMEMKAKTKTI